MKLIFFNCLGWVTPIQQNKIYLFPIFYMQYAQAKKQGICEVKEQFMENKTEMATSASKLLS